MYGTLEKVGIIKTIRDSDSFQVTKIPFVFHSSQVHWLFSKIPDIGSATLAAICGICFRIRTTKEDQNEEEEEVKEEEIPLTKWDELARFYYGNEDTN